MTLFKKIPEANYPFDQDLYEEYLLKIKDSISNMTDEELDKMLTDVIKRLWKRDIFGKERNANYYPLFEKYNNILTLNFYSEFEHLIVYKPNFDKFGFDEMKKIVNGLIKRFSFIVTENTINKEIIEIQQKESKRICKSLFEYIKNYKPKKGFENNRFSNVVII